MRNIIWLFCFGILLLYACQEKVKEPNIVIILADDLGYGDPEVYNAESKIPTPNINKLAASGMRFTDAHTPSSVCSPTRYGLLTGRYAWRTELKKSVLWAWDKPLIAQERLTLPKMLKSKNYHSACIGKWHLGWRWPSNENEQYANDTVTIGDYNYPGRRALWKKIDFENSLGGGPLEAGFDYYFGDDVPNFPPYVFFENDQLVSVPLSLKPDSLFGIPGPMIDGWKLEEVMPSITQKAVDYIQQRAKKDKPFFLYFALTAPHTPIAPAGKFKDKSKAGLYGDFVHEVDWSVGEIMTALKQTGVLNNTIVFFTSDNGSPQRDGTNMSGPIGSVKKYGHDPSKPWRGMKADIWEGGHRVPFIVSWPAKIDPNTKSDQLICLTDIISSIASILDIPNQPNAMEDSFDVSPGFLQKEYEYPIRETIVHHSGNGIFAVRKKNWKLILGNNSGGFSNGLKIEGIPVATEGQLYDLSKDPEEQNNLYALYPDKVKELTTLLNEYKTRGTSKL
ncbi:arylsulfatase [Fulvivirgaceae bacterium BMA10]|uniref:Arylsulfatase n=1 Tax=Splendidivirga corallicola TaxID=3051826 RepID=A0ABT8KNZ3_9BACT|nr:arylsulfatase [Fulvivirgaceae bacterium BMA10]